MSQPELTELARSIAANFLIETDSDSGAGPVFRLFHQALNDTLLRRRARKHNRASDERALTYAMLGHGRSPGWEHSPPYLLRSLPTHAATAKLIDDLLSDETYLLYADLHRLVLDANDAVADTAVRNLRTIRFTPQAFKADASERLALFSVTQALEYGQVSYSTDTAVPYVASWARAQSRGGLAALEGHQDRVRSVCQVTAAGRTLLASASHDGTVRLWDPATGQQTAVLEGHQGWFDAVCQVTAAGRTLLATASHDRTVRLWDPATGQQTAALEGHQSRVRSVCQVTPADRTLLATASHDRTVRLWDLGRSICVLTIPLHHDAQAIAWVEGVLAIALSVGVIVVELNATIFEGT